MVKKTFSDEMFTVRWVELRSAADVAEEEVAEQIARWAGETPQKFDDWVRGYLDYIDGELVSLALPPSRAQVIEVDDSTWAIADESRSALPGYAYIRRHAEKFSQAWWLARLAARCVHVLEATNADEKLHVALALGEDRERFASHKRWLASIRSDRKAKEDRSKGGKATAGRDRQKIIQKMSDLVEQQGLSVRSAASFLERSGEFGRTADGIRAVYREAKKTGHR